MTSLWMCWQSVYAEVGYSRPNLNSIRWLVALQRYVLRDAEEE